MKQKLLLSLLVWSSISLITGCTVKTSVNMPDSSIEENNPESDNELGGTDLHDDRQSEDSSNTDSTSSKGTATKEAGYSGDYDPIFENLIFTPQVAKDFHLVKDGYDFCIDSSHYIGYYESVGPAISVGDQLQYIIKVQDKTNEEIFNSDVAEKLKNAGGKTLDGPRVVSSSGTDYVYFEYSINEEHGIAINYPGPDKNHAIGVQVAILDNSVDVSQAVDIALSVAESATITKAANTSEAEINALYEGAKTPTGTRVDNATIKFKKCKYSFNVPEGYYQSFYDEYDYRSTQYYESMYTDVIINLEELDYHKDAEDYINSVTYGEDESQTSVIKTSEGDIAYKCYFDDTFEENVIYSAMVLDEKYIYSVQLKNKTEMPDLSSIAGFYNNEELNTTASESANQKGATDFEAIGPHTAIQYDQIFEGEVNDIENAKDLIDQYGDMQREKYDNEEVKSIEKELQSKYDIQAVNLGELDIETAKDVKRAVSYMFNEYPILYGSLNTISLANISGQQSTNIAITQEHDLIRNKMNDEYPKVIKNEILLNANKFLNRENMLKMCEDNVDSGYWCDNAYDPSKIIVHELGHHLLNVLQAKNCGLYVQNGDEILYLPCLIDENLYDAYVEYTWSNTALRQDIEKQIVEDSYKIWKSNGNSGSEEDFRGSISQYAKGIKYDGGVSYHETCAEAIADIYCNGDNAAEASKLIVDEISKLL